MTLSASRKTANEKYARSEKGKKAIARAQRRQYLKNKEKYQERHLIKTYGITMEEYNLRFDDQDGCCGICGTHQSELTQRLFVDHCHDSGDIRGLLCNRCNTALGALGDNLDGLMKAVDYLRKD